MRDLLITMIVFGGLPFVLARPYVGILLWSWIGYMNPHRLAWGFAYNMPFAQIIAVVTILSTLFDREPKRIPITPLTIFWLLLIAWMTITTFNAIYAEPAQAFLIKVIKIQTVTFLTMLLITDEKRIKSLVWVIVLSIGFFGVKGGVFTVLTGGGERVYGPADSFIEDNNQFAIALLMIIPLMRYLQLETKNKWVIRGLFAAMIICMFSVVGSQSRGALVALIALTGFFWVKSNKKITTAVIAGLMLPGLFLFMPDSWHERMDTIVNYKQDSSAMSRIIAWQYSIGVASERITGGGFESWSDPTFEIYGPKPPAGAPNNILAEYRGQGAHSIYFGVLGDHGWPGLMLFVLVLILAWRTASRITKNCRGHPEFQWIATLARMIQISMIAFMSGGIFLSMTYFDLPWHLFAVLLICERIIKKGAKENENSPSVGKSRLPTHAANTVTQNYLTK